MDTNVQALKNLYVARGGKLTDVENIVTSSDVINALAVLEAASKEEAQSTTPVGDNLSEIPVG